MFSLDASLFFSFLEAVFLRGGGGRISVESAKYFVIRGGPDTFYFSANWRPKMFKMMLLTGVSKRIYSQLKLSQLLVLLNYNSEIYKLDELSSRVVSGGIIFYLIFGGKFCWTGYQKDLTNILWLVDRIHFIFYQIGHIKCCKMLLTGVSN